MHSRLIAASLAFLLPVLAACYEDETLNPPGPPPVPTGGPLFQRYVAMGNSITAGVQSAGINDSTQSRSYAALLAAAMGTDFVIPRLSMPGCPPPFLNNLTQERVNLPGLPPATGTTCYLRRTNQTPNNVAVPFARVIEALDNLAQPHSRANALTLLFLGGRTQVQAMADQDPTFVTLWIGNNDAITSLTDLANPGRLDSLTPVNTFTVQYTQLLDAIEAAGAQAALVSVADVSVIPYASRGAVYWCIKNQPLACGPFPAAFPAAFTVNDNCAPIATGIPGAKGDSVLVPWPIGVARIGDALQGTATTIDCSVDTDVVTPAEYAGLRAAVAGYNAFIQAEAAARGFAYLDINLPLGAAVLAGQIPPFPDLSQALTGGNVLFGPFFSLDGVHPSTLAHRVVADSLASVINQKYSTTLPVPVCGAVTCPD